MRDKPFYELLSRIDDDSLLANFFNKVLGNLDMARIISAPRTFRHKDDENSRYCIDLFYDTCLWEMYLHQFIYKLRGWIKTLDEYLTEFGGSWKYYASSKRIESVNEYGGDDDDDNVEALTSVRNDSVRFLSMSFSNMDVVKKYMSS